MATFGLEQGGRRLPPRRGLEKGMLEDRSPARPTAVSGSGGGMIVVEGLGGGWG